MDTYKLLSPHVITNSALTNGFIINMIHVLSISSLIILSVLLSAVQ